MAGAKGPILVATIALIGAIALAVVLAIQVINPPPLPEDRSLLHLGDTVFFVDDTSFYVSGKLTAFARRGESARVLGDPGGDSPDRMIEVRILEGITSVGAEVEVARSRILPRAEQ